MPQQNNGFDCGVYSCLFSYQFVQYAEGVQYKFDFSHNTGDAIATNEFESISDNDPSIFRLQLKILIFCLFDCKEKCKWDPPQVPNCSRNSMDVVVIGKQKRLLFGKVVKARKSDLSSKHVVEICSFPNPKKMYLSDSDTLNGLILYQKFEKLKPMEVLNPKLSWKAKTSNDSYHYYVAN